MIKQLIEFLSNYFNKPTEETFTAEDLFGHKKDDFTPICNTCDFKNYCDVDNKVSNPCKYIVNLPDFDETKDSILIVDDNPGIVSFIKDDIIFLEEQGVVDLSNLNIISLYGNDAAFNLKAISDNKKLNIKWAIIDITLGGTHSTENGVVKLTGVDIFELLHTTNKDVKFIFYTGNNLNPYIKSNKKLIDQFTNITGKNITDFVLFKTSLDMDKRRNFIKNRLF